MELNNYFKIASAIAILAFFAVIVSFFYERVEPGYEGIVNQLHVSVNFYEFLT